jgi:uncharacterized membrane protein YjgN (DUF898 family)
VLRILTLGIYNFWGKTEVRRRIWSAVRIEGEPLEYTGTGLELFLGFIIVFAAVILPVTLVSVGAALYFGPESGSFDLFQLALYAVLFYLTGIALYRARRYRLARTRWRGIRGGMEGSVRAYARTYFLTGLLIPLTAGWIVPWRSTRLAGMITRDMRFGNRGFDFSASSGPLYPRFALFWLAAVVVFVLAGALIAVRVHAEFQAFDPAAGEEFMMSGWGIAEIVATLVAAYVLYAVAGAWYHAKQINHFAAHTHFGEATFEGRLTGAGLVWIGISNILIVLLSLGLLIPIAQARAARYMVDNLSIAGGVDFGEVAQGADLGIRRGEGLAQAFDVDAF